jgi:hypothetical protein
MTRCLMSPSECPSDYSCVLRNGDLITLISMELVLSTVDVCSISNYNYYRKIPGLACT